MMPYDEMQESPPNITYNTYNAYNNCIIQQNFYYVSPELVPTYVEEEYEEDNNY